MIIMFGLGNNEQKYYSTKHNIGRKVLEEFAARLGLSFTQKDNYYYTKSKLGNEDLYLIYSKGYMNTSGEALAQFLRFFKLEIKNGDSVYIIQDDSDQLELRAKLLPAGGSAGHKGIDSVYRHVDNLGVAQDQIWRLKIGIRPEHNTNKSETFVLSALSKNDDNMIKNVSHLLQHNMTLLENGEHSKLQNVINSL